MLRSLLDKQASPKPTLERRNTPESLRLDLTDLSAKTVAVPVCKTPPLSPSSRVSTCKHCKHSFYASYSSGGMDFCGKDCETCFLWHKPKTPTSISTGRFGFHDAKGCESPRSRQQKQGGSPRGTIF